MLSLPIEPTRTVRRRHFLFAGSAIALLAACSAPSSPVPPPAKPAPTSAPAKATAAPPAAATAAPKAPAPAAPKAPTSAAKSTQAPSKLAQMTTFKLGLTLPQFIHSYAFVAKDQGFYEKANLDLEIVAFDADSTALKALLAGEINALDGNPSGALASIEKGSNLKIAGTFWKKVHFMLYAKKDIKDVPDLAGKSIAISAPNSLPHVVALAVLRDAKIDPGNVNFVAVGAQGLVPSLVSGKVDASSAAADFLPVIQKEADLHAVFAYKDRLPKYVRGSLMVSDDKLRSDQAALTTFMIESTRGLRFELDAKNKGAVVQAMLKNTGNSQQQAEFAWQWFTENKIGDANAYVSPDELQYMQELNVLIKNQEKVLPVERVATWDIQKQVIAALGEYKG